ncbi:MAG: tRNA 2-thiouridine(34) synthase MnmA [Bacilli bacterium]
MKKVLIGMSGGVDSSVAALLLQKQGYEVIGATMVLFDINSSCLSSKALEDAKKVCDNLKIKHYVIEFKDIFNEKVINNFIECYKNGYTPNPCIECNKHLKFGALYKKAKELGIDFIATGHYAKIEEGFLKKAQAVEKDQTYFLYGINKEVLNHTIFPLQEFKNKDEIRKLAIDNKLPVATKKDSQEICFIPSNNYRDFLEKNTKDIQKIGNFINLNGEIIGSHNGIAYYTVGQRKKLGITNNIPLYVVNINPLNNTITLGEEKDLYKSDITISNINILVNDFSGNIKAKIRSRAKESSVNINWINDNTIKVKFMEPQKSVSKGQSLVFYKDDICLGGGIII